MSNTFTTAFEVELSKGDLYEIVEVSVEIEYSGYSYPARMHGHPDNWTPEESGMEVTRVEVLDEVEGFTKEEIELAVLLQHEDKINDECWGYFEGMKNDC